MARAAAAAGTIMSPVDDRDLAPGGDRGRGPAGAALVSALLLQRQGHHPGADRRGGRLGLRRDRAHRRCAAGRAARARPAHRLRGPAGDHRAGGRRGDWLRSRDHGRGGLRARRPDARLGRLRRAASDCSLPIVLKGVQTGADARLALDHGARGCGRLQPRRAPARRRPGDARDPPGGGRGRRRSLRGADRRRDPPGNRRGHGAGARGAGGARRAGAPLGPRGRRASGGPGDVLEILRAEVELALVLLGCPTPAQITPEHVRAAPRLG